MAVETAEKPATEQRKPMRTVQGIVESAKTKKTLKVVVIYQTKHPKYGKYLKRSTTYHVHDEKSEGGEGDTVEITECRPMSRTKHHRLVRVVTKAPLKIATVLDDEKN